jgi:endonuclease/exonuclease/phosphatase family metal-dependent hydrolase
MEDRPEARFRLMTYNIKRATKDSKPSFANIAKTIKEVSPDILVVQEATEYQDADGTWHSGIREIEQEVAAGYHTFLGPTLLMSENLDVRQATFVEGIFRDWQELRYGNAILSRWKFVGFSDPSEPGRPRNIPLYRAPVYQGSRDSEPRHAVVSRIDNPPTYPFVIGVHFSSLKGERGTGHIPSKAEEAELARVQQARRVLSLLRENVLEPRKLTFLLGDLNATKHELCVSAILEKEGGLMRLRPQNGDVPTHPRVAKPVDHIFVFPPERVISYKCWIVDGSMAREGASDHLPVAADVVVSQTPVT